METRIMERFYKPDGARLGDVIPYFADGVFHIFYLMRFADDTHDRPETTWGHLSTTDFVAIQDHGIAIPQGAEHSDDPSVATGSVIRVGDEYHAYYTGFSDWNVHNGGRNQTVLRARSTDLLTWIKDDDLRIVADENRYDPHDWRDPFVFEDADGTFRMLVSAQVLDGPKMRRGALAELVSTDRGESWNHAEAPFWAPGLTYMHECADLFQMGEHSYLVFSTITERSVTRYRMAADPHGPWVAPDDDELDGLGLYAAKTVTDGHRRYLVGWCVNREAGKDDGAWLWGGNLVVHELRVEADGSLSVHLPDVVRQTRERDAVAHLALEELRATSAGGYAGVTLCEMPEAGLLDVVIVPAPGSKRFGIELRTTAGRDRGYAIVFEPALGRIVIDRLHRFGGERPLDIRPYQPGEEVRLTVEFDGEIAVVYIDERKAITLRGYDTYGTEFGAFVIEGDIATRDGRLAIISERKTR